MTTALFLFVTPNTYKTFYWPAASVSHTLPPVLACAALIPLLLARTRRGRALAITAAVLMAAFLATLSEETAIVVVMVLLAALIVSGRVVPAADRGFVRLWCAGGIAGTAAGALVLITSPAPRTAGALRGGDHVPPRLRLPRRARCARSRRSRSPW